MIGGSSGVREALYLQVIVLGLRRSGCSVHSRHHQRGGGWSRQDHAGSGQRADEDSLDSCSFIRPALPSIHRSVLDFISLAEDCR